MVGTPPGIASFIEWSRLLQNPITADPDRDKVGPRPLKEKLWPPYPGFEAAFASVWPEQPVWMKALESDSMVRSSRDFDPNKRAYDVVNIYLDAIRTLAKRDEKPTVIVCIVPEQVWLNCRPESRVPAAAGVGVKVSAAERSQRRAGQGDLCVSFDSEQYQSTLGGLPATAQGARNGARHPRADCPRDDVAHRPPTKDDRRLLTPLPDRAWNLSTSLYYKAGAKPWRLAEAREGVCYIDIPRT